MYRIIIIILFFGVSNSNAQELNCVVNINTDEIGVSNKQVFVTMQSAIFEYMNNTKCTSSVYQNHEKNDCSITIFIRENHYTNQFKSN